MATRYLAGIHWFRKGLRLHDNPALIHSLKHCKVVYPVFVLDPYFIEKGNVGANRWRFLSESLKDLDMSLKKLGSRLFVIRGNPHIVLKEKFKEWNIEMISLEKDTEPYARRRDEEMMILCNEMNVNYHESTSHTLYDMDELYLRNSDKVCTTFASFTGILSKVGPPEQALELPTTHFPELPKKDMLDKEFNPPELNELGINVDDCGPHLYPGGESLALERLSAHLNDHQWICHFEKPQTQPNSLEPSTTVLSPYLKFGCLSARLFYHRLSDVYQSHGGKHASIRQVTLEGQLIWREFYYFVGSNTQNFDQIVGNKLCRQIKWDINEEYLNAWSEGRTGYPFIDAVMAQLRQEGWIHHLARHAVACFLTRGDLYISWEEGMKVFDNLLLDADWSLNAGNWMWLSTSAFFHQYFRVYSPVTFGKKTDPNGDYIRKYIPQLKHFPKKYIYEPWTAPLSLQKSWNCIIGQDYPMPIVNHAEISKINMQRLSEYFGAKKQKKEEKEKSSGVKKTKLTNKK
mmetsp:Transcript_22746/g.26727  ORF Transcript_22746/g.26727 Transcript_22746/m.26727 type:complete len:516 (+) Transcript_22746:215-1762(+)